MKIDYDFCTAQQGFIGTVSIEGYVANEDDETLEAIREDLSFRQEEEAWENDKVYGVYHGDVIYPE